MALVLDTGPVLAALDAKDPDHERCAALLSDTIETLVVPVLVLGELDYWLRKRFDERVWLSFAEDVAEGAYRLYHLDERELLRAAQLEAQYSSLRLGLVDACVVVACESLGETKVATLNRRDFAVVRPRHCDTLRLLPD